MKARILACCLLACLGLLRPMQAGELEQIKANYRSLLLSTHPSSQKLIERLTALPPEQELSDQMVVELHERYPLSETTIRAYLKDVQADGTWPDINYQDRKRSGWDTARHTKRMLELAKAYADTSFPLYKNKEVLEVLRLALSYWLELRPQCLNWWYNQISVPKTLGATLILVYDELSADEQEAALAVMEQAQIGRTGQNKVWLAGNVLIRALLESDEALVQKARAAIVGEVSLANEEGIQADWSFHQHGPQQQFGNYGLAFLSSMSFYASLFADTSLAFDTETIDVLHQLIEQGYAWVVWDGQMDVNALGRQLFHQVALHKGFSVGFAAIELAKNKNKALQQTCDRYIAANFTRPYVNTKVGHKHFWKSDYTIHRRPSWMASLKMASRRVVGTETVNEDNLLGYYLADGALYLYTHELDYLNSFPLWDWRKIPGVTAYESKEPLPSLNRGHTGNSSEWVGGFSLGERGLSVMQLNRDGLQAHKLWYFDTDFVFCLGGAITTKADSVVTTSVDQRLQKQPFYHWTPGGWRILSGALELNQPADARFISADLGYIICDASNTLYVESGEKQGNWKANMGMYSSWPVTDQQYLLYLSHGVRPKEATYAYFLLPNTTADALLDFKTSRVEIIQNDAQAQLIYLPAQDEYWGMAYAPFTLKLAETVVQHIPAGRLFYLAKKDSKYLCYLYNPTEADSDRLDSCTP